MSYIADEHKARQPKPNYKVRYSIGQFAPGATYGSYPGDLGLIIPKLLGARLDEALVRQGRLIEYRGKDEYECGVCGNKFTQMNLRDSHYRKRHGERRGPQVKNLDELTPSQREAFRHEINQEYETLPNESMIGDPEDAVQLQEEKMAEAIAPIQWDKTKASRK